MARAATVALLLALAACGNDGDDREGSRASDAAAGQDSALPSPEGATGSVTGMPGNPGPGTAPLAGSVDATPVDPALSTSGEAATDQATPVDGVFVLSEAPLFPPAPESPAPPTPPTPPPAEPRAAFVQPAEDAPRPPAGTEAATESTTFEVPVDPED